MYVDLGKPAEAWLVAMCRRTRQQKLKRQVVSSKVSRIAEMPGGRLVYENNRPTSDLQVQVAFSSKPQASCVAVSV